MALTRVLIAVKTYPSISGKYDELVCTAGFREDGTWIRLYPIPFRKKSHDEQYRKYDWIEVDLEKNTSDFRPESFRLHSWDTRINIISHINTSKNWEERKKYVLNFVHSDLDSLIKEAQNKRILTSLAVFKPTKILDFKWEEVDREWDKKKIAQLKNERSQLNLFEHPEDPFEVVKKLPYKFQYYFEDINGKKSTLMIEDWEIGQLYWNCLKKYNGNESQALEDVRKKYFDEFAKTKDLYFFLGTSLVHHYVSHNPFMIIGTFHPKIQKEDTQLNLDF